MGDMADYYGMESIGYPGGYDPFDEPGDDPDAAEQENELRDEMRQFRKTYWQMRDGKFIAVAEMSDSHLVNTIRMLRRHAEVKMMADAAHLGAYLDSDPPDGAYGAATQAEGELLEMGADDYLESTCPTFPALLAEAEKRGLDV